MINLDGTKRPTFDTLLHTSRGTVFPETFYSFLHNYVSSINELPTDLPPAPAPQQGASVSGPSSIAPSVSGATIRSTSSGTPLPAAPETLDMFPSDSDHRLERIWADYESIEPYIVPESTEEPSMDVKIEYTTAFHATGKPLQVRTSEQQFLWYL